MLLLILCRDNNIEKLRERIVEVIADPYFSIPSEEAKMCLQAARDMIQYFSVPNPVHHSFSAWLFSQLNAVVEAAKTKGQQQINKEKLWIGYHELTSSKLFVTKWEVFLANVSGMVPPLLYQHITDKLFEDIIKKSIELPISETSVDDVIILNDEEENAIHYVGGYVLRELKRDHSNSFILPLLEKLTDSEKRPAIDANRQWITLVDRGGLTKITDEAYQCFYDIEIAIRRFLKINNTRNMNETFSKKVIEAILSDDNLLFDWCFAAECIDQEIADQCLQKIVKKWFIIRGFSFASSLMEMYKQATKKGTDKAKPLRTKLFTDTA